MVLTQILAASLVMVWTVRSFARLSASLLPCCFLRLNAAAAPAVHLSTLCAWAWLMQTCRLLSLTKEFVH